MDNELLEKIKKDFGTGFYKVETITVKRDELVVLITGLRLMGYYITKVVTGVSISLMNIIYDKDNSRVVDYKAKDLDFSSCRVVLKVSIKVVSFEFEYIFVFVTEE